MSGIIMIIVIALLIDWLNESREKKVQSDVESAHKRAYEAIDEAYGDTIEAREYKAKMDMLVYQRLKEQRREYRPKELKQVTTKKEREERAKCESLGIDYYSKPVIDHVASEIARNKNFEFFVQQRMRVFGCSREEAEEVVMRGFETDGLTRGNQYER